LDFESTPVTDVVAQLNKAFGVTIVISRGLDTDRSVSFTVDNITGSGARLDAVTSLSNALDADFNKVFVVSKIADETTPPDPVIDINAPVVFQDDMSMEDAIDLVAGVDDASVQFYSMVHGTAMFPSKDMTTVDAARDLARQSHTLWKTYYMIVPRRHGRVPDGSKVIGYTDGGQPITELPLVTFRVAPKPVPPAAEPNPNSVASESASRGAKTPAGVPGQGQDAQNQQYNPNSPYVIGGQNQFGSQFDNGNLGWFSSSPSGGDSFSGNTGFSSVTGPGSIYQGGGYTSPGGGLTILPSSPYSGTAGGAPVVIQQGYGYTGTGY
jgi:hypothetical protein